MTLKVKICGLSTKEAIETAQDNGADFLGFVFFDRSPRNIKPTKAAELAPFAKLPKVAVTVNASDEFIDSIVKNLKPEYIQLHGTETLARAKEIKEKFGVKIIKATTPDKVDENPLYDFLMIDSPGGGTGKQFDYANFKAPVQPWFLSGGLNSANIREAVQATGAKFVDISSGVESVRGVKDINKIAEFLKTAKSL